MQLIVMTMSNLQLIISLLLVVIVAACFLGRYVVLTRKLVISSFGMLAFSVFGTIIANLFIPEDLDKNLVFVLDNGLTVLLYIYSFIFYMFAFKEKKVLRAIESTVCFFLFSLYISTFSQMTVIYLVGGTEDVVIDVFYENLADSPLWLAISGMALLITLALFIIAYFGFYKPKKYYIIGIPHRVIFVIWAALFIVFPFVPAMLPSEEVPIEFRYHIMSIMFAIGIIILGIAAPVFVIISSADKALREQNKSQEAYMAAELEYIGRYKKKQVETRAFRHDIKNNLAITRMMLEEGHTEEAKEHIRDMLGEVSSLSPKYVTGDEMLDIIISMKADRMDELNIKFTLDGVTDGGLNIKPMDMCSVFANALDNAIEAASSCEDPYVSFSIKRTDKFFIIKITNSASGKIDIEKLMSTSGYTSKNDKKHHGFGLMNVRRAVEECNGILKAESLDSSFTLSVMMPRKAVS
ncbi:MAG: GHKL domain-containing protein [Saccharofermentans sp.]|nr:GHKL domain-containing protein [Saccharofermentans sp.]